MDSVTKKIGCIGTGNMGGAILSRLAARSDPSLLSAYDSDDAKSLRLSRDHGIRMAASAEELAAGAEMIIMAVKPDAVEKALASIKGGLSTGKTVVSIAAGVSISRMEKVIGGKVKIIRVMPNTPVMVGEGMSVLSPNDNVDDESLREAERIFSFLGRVLVLPERLMDAVTGLSGSGPAYVFTFIEALADGGVRLGIPRDKALVLAAQTVMGSAKYLLESGDEPSALRGRVTTPGGTTIEGLYLLERSGFAGIVMEAVERAAKKSREIGDA